MVRDAERRAKKYERSISPERIGRTLTAVKDIMVEQEKPYLANITMLENKIKALCEAQGIPTIQIAQYINYGRQLYSKSKRFSQATLSAEAQYLTDLWTSRGLLGSKLVEIAALFGVTPSAPPTVAVNFIPLWYEKLRVGASFMSPLLAGARFPATGWNGYLLASPLILTRKMRIDRIEVYIQQAPILPALVNIGLYESNGNAEPTKLLAQVDNINASLPRWRGGAINVTLEKGLYFFACVCNNDDIGYASQECFATPLGTDDTSPTILGKWYVAYPFAPLPDPFPLPADLESDSIVMRFRLAQLF